MSKNDNHLWVFGAGGGDSKSPTRTPDNLLSQDYFELVLAISEGPIKGLVSGAPGSLENFFAGETPAQNSATGQTNFSDFTVIGYTGRDDDPSIQFKLGGVSSNLPVGVRLSSGVAVTRQTSSPQRGKFNRLEVRIQFSSLVKTNDDGSFESTGRLSIEYKPASSSTWQYFEGTPVIAITGKTSSGYAREFVIDVPRINEDYDIRVTKLSPDGVYGVDEDVCDLTWESVQTVDLGERKFPNVAMFHIHGKASNQFSSLPEFSSVCDGIICKVPSNYNPETRTYDESTPWNGTLKNAFCTNGPWILYTLLTDTRFGLSRYYKGITCNRYQFYEVGKWCDEMVPDGRGGLQPRFTFNEWIQDMKPGMELLRYIAGSFNSLLVDDGNGVISLIPDRPRAYKQIFTPENVSAEGFNYTFSDISTRYNDITVSFVNPALDWQTDQRAATIDNTADIAKNGRIPHNFVAVGCTDPQEAVRRANYRYLTANTEVTTVSFITSRFGLITQLLDTILVADPDADWSTGGRIKSVSGGIIHLRDPIWFEDATQREMRIQTYSGLVSLQVAPTVSGLCSSLSIVSGTFPENVPDRTVFTIEDRAGLGMSKPFKVLSLEEIEGKPDKVRMTALEVNVNKYPDADLGTASDLVQYAYTRPGQPVLPLTINLETPRPIITKDGSFTYHIEASWVRPIGANTASYDVEYKREGDSAWITVNAKTDRALLGPVQDGVVYRIRLFAITPTGQRSERCLDVLYTVQGSTGTLRDVEGFQLTSGYSGWEAAFTIPSREDMPDFDYCDIRVGPSNAVGFDSLPTLYKAKSSPQIIPWRAAGDYTVYAKLRNTSGGSSRNAVSVPWSIQPPAIPVLDVARGMDVTEIRFQDCTTSQPLMDGFIRIGPPSATWEQAVDAGTFSGATRVVTILPDALEVRHVLVRVRDAGGNLSGIARAEIPPAAGDIKELLDILQNGIPENSLSPALLEKINLITAPETTAGSVNARLATLTTQLQQSVADEATARATAISQLSTTLAAAIQDGDNNVYSLVQQNHYTKAQTDQSIASASTTIQAGVDSKVAAAVQEEATARATVDGHFGAQWSMKVSVPSAGVAAIGGIAVAGTSSATEGPRLDMAFRADAFYFLPPAGQSNTTYAPLIYYPNNTVVNGVNVSSGLYTRSAFIEYIRSDRIDTRGLQIRDEYGTLLFGSQKKLDFSQINANPEWSSNLADLSWWRKGGSSPWPKNGEENTLYSTGDVGGVGPKGGSDIVWYCREAAGDGGAGGGWNANETLVLDQTKTYRFVVPIKKRDGSGGNAWWGVQQGTVCDLNTTNPNSNPYFAVRDRDSMSSDRWYLFVGYVFPYGSTGNSNEGSGIYDCKTGALVQGGTNYCHVPGGARGHRAYQYYTNIGSTQLFGRPMINLVDGTEPPLREYFEQGAVLNSAAPANTGNMIPVSDFQNDWGSYWRVRWNQNNITINTLNRTDAVWADGAWMPRNVKGIAINTLNQAGVIDYEPSTGFPVTPGRRYEFSCSFFSHRCGYGIGLAFLDGNNSFVGGWSENHVNSERSQPPYYPTLADAHRLSVFATAPAGAQTAIVYIRKGSLLAGTDSWVWLFHPFFGAAGADQTTASAYAPGPLSSVRNLGYSGDLNATYGATIGVNLGGQINYGNASTYIADAAIDGAKIRSLTVGVLNTAMNGGSGVGIRMESNKLQVFDGSGARRGLFGSLQ